jgi:DNA-binding NarL/FixJ family response regulator
MPDQRILCLGTADSAVAQLTAELAERPGTYVVTSAATLDSPATQLADVDCVVAVHDSPAADTSDSLRILHHEAPELPVVVYALETSADLAAQAVNTGVDRYVGETDVNGWQRLAARSSR